MDIHAQPKSPFPLVLVLLVLAVLAMVVGLAGAFSVLAVHVASGRLSLVTVGWMGLLLVSGGVAGGVLWALGWLCQRHHEQGQVLGRIARAVEALAESGPRGVGAGTDGPAAEAGQGGDQGGIVEQLRELNINVLLSEDQRRAKYEHVLGAEVRQLVQRVERSAAGGDAPAAESALERLRHLAPDHPELARLSEVVGEARGAFEARELAEAASDVEELMSAGKFDEAKAAAERLLGRYPARPEAVTLLARVRREAEALRLEQRRRMLAKVEKEATARHWRAALAAAEELLEAYPDSPEAAEVRSTLRTLTDNARIEEARELRDEIRDLLSRRRYAEALARARDLIRRFPTTAAAEELRTQMARLEELASSEGEARRP